MTTEIELRIIENESVLHLRYDNIVQTEPSGIWYHFAPSPELVDVFARFMQRVIWQREGKPDHPITDMSEVGDEARAEAVGFLDHVFTELIEAYDGKLYHDIADIMADVSTAEVDNFDDWVETVADAGKVSG